MKKIIFFLSLMVSAMGFAQPYQIDWFTIDGGGGTSAGGVFTVSGTVGQHDAGGPMTGGNWSLTGGFWSAFAVPSLRIFLTTPNTAVVAWPAPSTGWTLQGTANLTTPNWSAVGGLVNVVGNENQVVISPLAGHRFYRLKKP